MRYTNWTLIGAVVAGIAAPVLAATGRPTGLVIVGLKPPVAASTVCEIKTKLNVVRVMPGHVALLVRPKKGQTVAQIERAHPRIAYAELETVYLPQTEQK